MAVISRKADGTVIEPKGTKKGASGSQSDEKKS